MEERDPKTLRLELNRRGVAALLAAALVAGLVYELGSVTFMSQSWVPAPYGFYALMRSYGVSITGPGNQPNLQLVPAGLDVTWNGTTPAARLRQDGSGYTLQALQPMPAQAQPNPLAYFGSEQGMQALNLNNGRFGKVQMHAAINRGSVLYVQQDGPPMPPNPVSAIETQGDVNVTGDLILSPRFPPGALGGPPQFGTGMIQFVNPAPGPAPVIVAGPAAIGPGAGAPAAAVFPWPILGSGPGYPWGAGSPPCTTPGTIEYRIMGGMGGMGYFCFCAVKVPGMLVGTLFCL